jgi:hypothetical protein
LLGKPQALIRAIIANCTTTILLKGVSLGATIMSEQSPIYHQPAAPDVQAILTSPSASLWLKDALQAALQRDPVDAAQDAELLALVLASRADSLLVAGAARLGLSPPRR